MQFPLNVNASKAIQSVLVAYLTFLACASSAEVVLLTPGTGTDLWTEAIADAIDARTDGSISMYELAVLDTGGQISGYTVTNTNQVSFSQPATGTIIIRINWQSASTNSQLDTTTIGNVLADALLAEDGDIPIQFLQTPLHFIGHGVGGSLNAAIAKRFAERELWIDHFTLLDSYTRESDAPIQIYENIVFADNYFHTNSNQQSGPVDGAFNGQLYGLAGGYDTAHDNVHLWYHGTVDLTQTPMPVVNGKQIGEDWYDTVQRDETGYNYSISADYGNFYQRPAAGASSVIQGGIGNRVTAEANGQPAWCNILQFWVQDGDTILNSGTHPIATNDQLTLRVFGTNSESGSCNVTLYKDNDQNPFNGGLTPVSDTFTIHESGQFDFGIGFNTDAVTNGDDLFLCAMVSDTSTTRYFYAAPRLVFFSPTNYFANISVSPLAGDESDVYSFNVDYTDPNGEEPLQAFVVVDGIQYAMLNIGQTGNVIHFSFELTTLEAGDHQYYFSFRDNTGAASLTETFFGPFITGDGRVPISGQYRYDGFQSGNVVLSVKENGILHYLVNVDQLSDQTGHFQLPSLFPATYEFYFFLDSDGNELVGNLEAQRAVIVTIDDGDDGFELAAVELIDPDSDSDALPDYWEIQYFIQDGQHVDHDRHDILAFASGNDDNDGNGVPNFAEHNGGTDPVDPNDAEPLFTIDLSVIGDGTIDIDDHGPFTYNTPVTLTATPFLNRYFVGWSGDFVGVEPLTFTVSDHVDVTAEFSLTPKHRIPVTPGWSIISLPFSSNETSKAIFLSDTGESILGDSVWFWRDGEFVELDDNEPLQANTGYWIFGDITNSDTTLSQYATGDLSSGAIDLAAGWNLVGVTRKSTIPVEISKKTWHWNGTTYQRVQPGETMDVLNAYWVFVANATVIDVSGND